MSQMHLRMHMPSASYRRMSWYKAVMTKPGLTQALQLLSEPVDVLFCGHARMCASLNGVLHRHTVLSVQGRLRGRMLLCNVAMLHSSGNILTLMAGSCVAMCIPAQQAGQRHPSRWDA